MNLEQIYAILALLLAFGVPQPTVNTVQGILLASRPAQTQQISLPPPAQGVGGVGRPSSIEQSVEQPITSCVENVGLSVSQAPGVVGIDQWSSHIPVQYVERYTFVAKVTTQCGSETVIDYTYPSWYALDNWAGYGVVEGEKGTLVPPAKSATFVHPRAGDYQVTFVAHTKNNIATSTPVTMSYTSHGILTQQQINQIRGN